MPPRSDEATARNGNQQPQELRRLAIIATPDASNAVRPSPWAPSRHRDYAVAVALANAATAYAKSATPRRRRSAPSSPGDRRSIPSGTWRPDASATSCTSRPSSRRSVAPCFASRSATWRSTIDGSCRSRISPRDCPRGTVRRMTSARTERGSAARANRHRHSVQVARAKQPPPPTQATARSHRTTALATLDGESS